MNFEMHTLKNKYMFQCDSIQSHRSKRKYSKITSVTMKTLGSKFG